MSISKRLFIGNVHPEVTQGDLQSRFGSFGTVNEVELRTKNEDHFAFINMVFEDIHDMRKCVEALNNTRWKGMTLKVQYAKESFLEKLKRERAQQGPIVTVSREPQLPSIINRKPIRPDRPKMPDNFDFEIVGATERTLSSKPHTQPHTETFQKPDSASKAKKAKPTKFIHDGECGFTSNIVGFEDTVAMVTNVTLSVKNQAKKVTPVGKPSLSLTTGNTAVPVVKAGPVQLSPPPPAAVQSPVKSKPAIPDKAKKKKRKQQERSDSESDSEDSSEDENEKDGIPRFRGLAAISETLFSVPAPAPVTPKLSKIVSSQPQAPITEIGETTTPSPAGFKLKINPNKKAKSDELRLKSLSAHEALLNQRSSLIRHSLSKVEPPVVSKTTEDQGVGSPKSALFADTIAEEDDDQISFKVKPQYEGVKGQKMLKLKSQYGGDNRFQLDERFADDHSAPKNESGRTSASEKTLQLGIMEQLVGPGAPAIKTPPKAAQAKQFIRFDPTVVQHQQLILNPVQRLPETSPAALSTSLEAKPKKKKLKEKEEHKAIDEEKAKLRNPEAKPTFKVADNLKTLFSKESSTSAGSNFSILKAFGSDTTIQVEADEGKPKKNESKPRDQWNKNPFQYDSSDDEEDTKKVKVKVTTAPKPPESIVKTNSGPSGFFKKESFFFTEKDDRLKGVFEEFLKSTEDPAAISKAFNDSGREELKAIAHSKMKNAKRKGDKKINFQKLLKKKKTREALAKQKKNDERRALFQSKSLEKSKVTN